MSRLRNYTQALASGYVQMAANIVYTLASVPVALHYLSRAEFGLWALVIQLAGYLMLLDLGMSAAAMRILVDYKDHKTDGRYGSVILTGVLVNAVQALLVLGCGTLLAQFLPQMLDVEPDLEGPLRWLLVWQSLLTALNTAYRTPTMVLMAHQRYDIVNLSQALLFFVNLVLLWLCFELGQGVYSLMWSQAASQVLGCAVALAGCTWLRLWPVRGCWGRPTWVRFWELFTYGRDMFLYTLGHLFINASQAILITRVLGLEVGAIWSVCTRAFTMIIQFLYRIYDYSSAALAEMIVRGEESRLLNRFRSMVVVSSSLCVVSGILFAAANQPFVDLWTHGRISWSRINDLLLGGWLIVLVLVRNHTGLIGLRKEFGFLRYLYFLEGVIAISLGYLALRWGGVTWMLGVSLLASLGISFPYSVWRTSQRFGLSFRTVAIDWQKPAVRLGLAMAPLAGLLVWLGQLWPSVFQFAATLGVTGSAGALLFLRMGVDDDTRNEVARHVPDRWRWMRRLLGRPDRGSTAGPK